MQHLKKDEKSTKLSQRTVKESFTTTKTSLVKVVKNRIPAYMYYVVIL